MASFLGELRRRKVFQVAAVYAVVGWLLIEIAATVERPLSLPAWLDTLVIVLVIVGFPLAVVLAWAFQITPGGRFLTQSALDESLDATTPPKAVESALPPGSASAMPEKSRRTSIAVLPFDNLSPDPGDAYFSDGLTEEIITHLAYVSTLRVISRSTSMMLRNTQKDIKTIGQDLDVQYVLEGSVRKARDQLRVTAQLIDASSDEHVWVERHDGTMGDVFSVQERIAKRIADALKLELSPSEEKRLIDRTIMDPKAYETLIQSIQEGRKYSAGGIQRAIKLAEQVLQATGANARVYACLGYYYYQAYDFGVAYDKDTLDQGEAYASKALELDPTLPLALLAKGLMRYKRGDMWGFVRHARPAAELGHDSDALMFLAFVLVGVGRLDEARHYLAEALATDPWLFHTHAVEAIADAYEGNAGAGFDRIRTARDRFAPGEPFAGWWVAQIAAYAGRETEARQEFGAVAEMDAGLFTELCELFRRALDKDHDGVMEQLEDTRLNEVAKTDEIYPLFIANAMTHIGEHDVALDWLERSINWGFYNYRFLDKHNRFLAPLREDQRFRTLIAMAEERHRSFGA